MKSINSTNIENLVKVDFSDLKQVIETIENRPKSTVPNKGTSPFHKDYTKEEIAERYNLWVIGKDLTIG